MDSALETGVELIRQKRLDEAQRHFEVIARREPGNPRPLRGLVKVAQARRDPKELAERLDNFLAQQPNALHERVIRVHLRAMQGELGAARAEIPALLELAARRGPNVAAARRLMQLIQYSCAGSSRVQLLIRLRDLAQQHLKAGSGKRQAIRVLLAGVHLALNDRAAFLHQTEVLGEGGAEGDRVLALQRVAKKISAPSFPEYGAAKVFGIGLSRTGTSSLNVALNTLGLHSVHWLNPITRDLLHQDDFLLFDAFTDIPVSHQFEWLYHTFPNSRFILTTRSAESWQTSIAFHYLNNRGVTRPSDLSKASAKQRFRCKAGQMEMNLYGRFSDWREAFDAYHGRVREFFRDKPASRFLQLRIVDGEGWEPLCAFLNKPAPSTPFPNRNASPARRGS